MKRFLRDFLDAPEGWSIHDLSLCLSIAILIGAGGAALIFGGGR